MSARIIDGKAFAAGLRARVKQEAERLKLRPGLAVVLIGNDPASEVYVRNKNAAAKEAGFNSYEFRLADSASESEVLARVRALNEDKNVHGILVQFPTPKQVRQEAVLDAISPAKDVDGLTPASAGLLASGRPGLVPCTPLGVVMLLKDVLGKLDGADALVIGRSLLVGKPVAQLLLAENATVTIAHSKTRDLPALARRADILVAAIGKPEFVKGSWIKPGATVIDVGINRIDAGGGKMRLAGDVAFEEVKGVAGAITPVPGGVGPMTIACLLRNTLAAACRQTGVAAPEI